MNSESETIQYRTPTWLSDSLKLQLRCSFYAFRYFWCIAAIVLVVHPFLEAAHYIDHPWPVLWPMLAGLAGGTLGGPTIIIWRRLFQKKPGEIRADIGSQGVKMVGQQGFSCEANWPNLTWIKESSGAYILRFNKLFVRLPKRGFASGQKEAFRHLVADRAPGSALKWTR